jgi:DNA-binding transcriptional ArsR family regulator
MTPDIDLVLEALADQTRRTIFEHIVVRSRRIGDLAEIMPVSRQAVSHHVGVLESAGLVQNNEHTIEVVVEALPQLRTYFDRLWLEASLGDNWLSRRRSTIDDQRL